MTPQPPNARAPRDAQWAAGQVHTALLRVAQGGVLLATALAWALFLAGLPAYAAALRLPCDMSPMGCDLDGALTRGGMLALRSAGISLDAYIAYNVAVTLLVAIIWSAIGLLIFAQRAEDRMALLVALALVLFNLGLTGGPTAALGAAHSAWMPVTQAVQYASQIAMGLFLFLFPSGRFVPRWTRLAMLCLAAYEVFVIVPPPASPWNAGRWPIAAYLPVNLGLVGAALVAQVYRFRRVSMPRQRQQTKWALYGLGVALIANFALSLYGALTPEAEQPGMLVVAGNSLYYIFLLACPLSIAVAILRSGLFDIDVLINHTLVYGSLTAILAGVYFGSVALLQATATRLTGEHSLPPVAVVASTLLIAALFSPLRRRLQRAIDRRFYRGKYDAAKTLAAFGTALRREVDLPALTGQLAEAVEETMRPAHVSLWLREPGAR